MHEKDTSIVQRSMVQTDCVVVNQCETDSVEEFNFLNNSGRSCRVLFINTTERGLSRSRNMAIRNAWADICLICDDDETFEPDYETKILSAFSEHPEMGIIAFKVVCPNKKYSSEAHKISRFRAAEVSSWQIAFRREQLLKRDIWFDVKMGSGSGNGAGEENKLLYQMISSGMKAMYVPVLISEVAQTQSLWFKGYTEKYFIDMAWSARRIYGAPISFVYLCYWTLFRSGKYDLTFSKFRLFHCFLKGYFEKRD